MNHISITTLEAPELDIYARLSEGQLFHYNEPKEGLFIVESPKVIGRALDAGYEPVSFLMEERHIETEGREILERPVCAGVPVFTAPFDVLTRLTGFKLTPGLSDNGITAPSLQFHISVGYCCQHIAIIQFDACFQILYFD